MTSLMLAVRVCTLTILVVSLWSLTRQRMELISDVYESIGLSIDRSNNKYVFY